ncbi:MAG: AsmA-like C-terminal region-containing protein [Flavobacteriales bacterium]
MKADLQVDIALADLLRFAQVDTLEQVDGRLAVDARIEGRVRDVADLKPADLRPLRMGGTASLTGASLKLKGVRHRIEDLDAQLALEGNDAAIHSLKATLQGAHIVLKGRLVNLMPYLLFDDQRLSIQAEGSADRIDLAALLQADDAPRTKRDDDKSYALSLPASITLDLKARVEELVFADFSATAINGTIRMQDRVLKVSPVTFNTASGAVLGSLELDARGPGPFPLAVDATFQDIDIKELFREFGDFGQDFIGHRHLSGRSQAKITLRVPLSPALDMDMDRLLCTLDIAIDNGGIKGHAPLLAVADHLRDNRLVAPFVNIPELRKRLGDVRFERLENRIEIRDGAVHIPTMEVKSSAMDLELSGTHWFDDRIEHHLNFRLSDLFRMGKPTRDEFGPIMDDGTGMRVFLRMYGTASDPQFSNDGAMASARRKQQFQQEKQELKSVLREGFGIGKGKGTDPVTTQPEQTKPVLEVEWGDEKSKTEEAPAEKPRKGLGKFLDKSDTHRTKDKDEQERIKVEDP